MAMSFVFMGIQLVLSEEIYKPLLVETAQEKASNRSMSKVRVSVEWGFGDVVN